MLGSYGTSGNYPESHSSAISVHIPLLPDDYHSLKNWKFGAHRSKLIEVAFISICNDLQCHPASLCSLLWCVISANAIIIGTYVYIFFASEFCSKVTEPAGQGLR